jgi:hypothetical protein
LEAEAFAAKLTQAKLALCARGATLATRWPFRYLGDHTAYVRLCYRSGGLGGATTFPEADAGLLVLPAVPAVDTGPQTNDPLLRYLSPRNPRGLGLCLTEARGPS